MRKGILLVAALSVASAAPAAAQSKRVEVSAFAGYVFSDGVSGDPVKAGDGNTYDRVDPKDSGGWGLSLGILASENVEVGFLFSQQMSSLEVSGTATRDLGDFNVNNYHGYFAYNFGSESSGVRPYLMAGVGATSYGTVSFTTAAGQSRDIGGETQLSPTLGAGVKFFPSPGFGARFGIRLTPTYIKSDAVGWWCDPFWGCYVVGNAQYSNQWELAGGIIFWF